MIFQSTPHTLTPSEIPTNPPCSLRLILNSQASWDNPISNDPVSVLPPRKYNKKGVLCFVGKSPDSQDQEILIPVSEFIDEFGQVIPEEPTGEDLAQSIEESVDEESQEMSEENVLEEAFSLINKELIESWDKGEFNSSQPVIVNLDQEKPSLESKIMEIAKNSLYIENELSSGF